MTKITYNRSRWVQDDINYFQWLQSTTGHRRICDSTPERVNSRRSRVRQIGTQGMMPTLKMMITSTRPFLQVNWAWSPAKAPSMDGVTLPLNAVTSWIKGEVRDVLRVSTLWHPGRNPLAEAFYIYLRIHYSSDQYLRRRIFPRMKQSYCHERLHKQVHLRRWHRTIEGHWGEQLSLDWSEHIAAIHCAAWNAFPSTSIMDNRSGNWQIKRQRSLDTEQAKTIGGAGTNGDSGQKC